MNNLYKLETLLHKQGYKYIVGTDEVGRGPMAGPLVAAAVILPENTKIEGINDSKRLTAKRRNELFHKIKKAAIEVQVSFIDVETIDKINVLEASRRAMINCIEKMETKVDYILSDAVKLNFDIPNENIIKGDRKSASIAAASIIAKVTRDNYMVEMDKIYPNYGFKNHKGYVTQGHLQALNKYGVTKIHRRSFSPVRKAMNILN